MKNYIMITAFLLFIIASVFSGMKVRKIKKMAAEKARLETEFDNLKKEKENLQIELTKKTMILTNLVTTKNILEKELIHYKADIIKQKNDYEAQIAELTSLSPDTVYERIFTKWPTFDGVLKYRFAENQIRNIHLSLVERDNYQLLYQKTNFALVKCDEVNLQNNKIIENLSDQNKNLNQQKSICENQNSTLQDELKLSNKLLNKQKTKGFVFKSTTVLASIGLILFALK